MLLRPIPNSRAAPSLTVERVRLPRLARVAAVIAAATGIIRRRWGRERRRRQVGRAFDMALEVARIVPRGAEVLDVGCGNGFIAHHLSAMLGRSVVGIDLAERAAAPITYLRYDGRHFPRRDQSIDVVLFCYVLHHAWDAGAVLHEAQRVLHDGGVVIVYEDIPRTRWDRAICRTHDLQWRRRSGGACTFRQPAEWQGVFTAAGFEVIAKRTLSRWRNLTHPVSRESYVLRLDRRT